MTASPQRISPANDAVTHAIDLVTFGCGASRLNDYVAALRNSGLAVHGETTRDAEQLSRLLSARRFDLILCNTPSDEDQAAIAATVQRHALDTAVLLLAADPASQLEAAKELGARDVIAPDDIARMVFTVQREYQSLLLRRELTATRKQLLEAEQRSSSLVEASRDAVAYVHEGMHVHANRSYAELFGFRDAGELEGLPIMDLLAPEHRDAARNQLRDADEDGTAEVIETLCVSEGGKRFPARLECSPASVEGEPCVQIVIRGQAEPSAPADGMAPRTGCDTLTGLPTRQAFLDRLEQALSDEARAGVPMTLGLLSIGNFQTVQQTQGLPAAEELLHRAALALTSKLTPETGLAARYDDHTLGFWLNGVDQDAAAFAQHCLTALPRHDTAGDQVKTEPAHDYRIGLAPATSPEVTQLSDWLNCATRALEQARQADSDAVVTCDATPAAGESEIDSQQAELIKDALENDRLRLRFQPVVSLHGDAREHYDVLPRLVDQDGGELPAEAFNDGAAPAERLAEIDRWVIRNAIKELASQRQDGRKVVFFVPLSRAALETDSILLWVCDCLREFQAKGAWLVFQFKETDLASVHEPASRLIEGLRKINCRTAVDQLSGADKILQLLPKLQIDAVKLAPDLTQRLGEDQKLQDRLRELHENLRRHKLKMVATAVEDANSLAALWTLGVHFVQGDFLQEPTSSLVTCELGQ